MDFRGFLFNDQQLGVRLFGNRDNNRFQYNLAAFWRLEKDTNSGLNSVVQRPRNDWVSFAPISTGRTFVIPGLTSQISVTYNMNREADEDRDRRPTASRCALHCSAICAAATMTFVISGLQRPTAKSGG